MNGIGERVGLQRCSCWLGSCLEVGSESESGKEGLLWKKLGQGGNAGGIHVQRGRWGWSSRDDGGCRSLRECEKFDIGKEVVGTGKVGIEREVEVVGRLHG